MLVFMFCMLILQSLHGFALHFVRSPIVFTMRTSSTSLFVAHVNNAQVGNKDELKSTSVTKPLTTNSRPSMPREIFGNSDKPYEQKAWQSGYKLVPTPKQPTLATERRRNDPWWVREEENKNPRMRPPYRPGWLQENENHVNISATICKWNIAQLRSEALKRGVTINDIATGKSKSKSELIQNIEESGSKYSLHDDNFTSATFVPVPTEKTHASYPESYEGGAENINHMRKKFRNIAAPDA